MAGDNLRMRTFAPGGVLRKHNLNREIALQWQQELHQGVYFVINRGGDSAEQITECVALFCEWDDRPKEEQAIAWKELNLPEPSMQVDSGGKSIHNYWVFENPISKDTWRDLQERLIVHANSDPAIKDPSRVMRLPGCWHFSKKTGLIGGQTSIIHRSKTRINAVQMDRILPDKAQVQRHEQVSKYKKQPSSDWEPRPIEEIQKALSCIPSRVSGNNTYNEYRNALWGLQEALAEIGRDPSEAIDLFEQHSPSTNSGWDVAQIARYQHKDAWAGWFWKIAELHGYDLKKTEKKSPAGMPSLPAGKDIKELTVDDILGPIEDGKLRNPRKERLSLLMEVLFQPKFNELTGEYEIASGAYVDNAFLDSLYLRLAEEHSVEINDKRAKDAFLYAAHKNSYHPVLDYLNGLEKDCEPLSKDDWELIALKVFGCTDANANKYLQRQLIAAVARTYKPGCKVDTALITHGKPEIGKSRFWAVMGGEWFSDSLGSLANMKDDLMLLHGAWIHEWGEIDRIIGKREAESVKHFITIQEDHVRPPYGRKVEKKQRQSILVGTTNRKDFIKDHTGNRRFPIFTAKKVDLDWVTANRDAIWSRAVAEFNADQRWWYDAEETKAINEVAEGFAGDDPFLETLEGHVHGLSETNIKTLCHSITGWEKFADDKGARQKIGFALNRLGFERDENDKRTITVPGHGSMRVCFFRRDTCRDTSAKGGQA